MHQQAQLRLRKDEVEKIGAQAFVVLALDTHRARKFKEENSLIKQQFVKDNSKTVEQYLGKAKVVSYLRVAM